MNEAFDLVVIGAGASGEGAADYAALRGATVALIENRAKGGDYGWPKAAAFRDWMINRVDRRYPDDSSHARGHERHGVTIVRGTGRLTGPGRVKVALTGGATRELEARKGVVLAAGSRARVPSIPGLEEAGYWTNVEATSLRELPASGVILGAGPSGVEFAQYFARYGVPTTIVQSNQRLNPTDHPRSSDLLARAFRAERIDVRTGARAQRVRAHAGPAGEHVIDLAGGASAQGHVVVLGIGRVPNLGGLGLETVGVPVTEGEYLKPDDRMRVAEGVYAVGDLAGREISTHLGHYEGEIAARAALGDDVRADLRAVPRCVYTDPELGAVGLTVEQAREQGRDAAEFTQDLAVTAKGYVSEAHGHVTIVADRADRALIGAFMAGPGATEAIHEAVLAVKLRLPLAVLEDTIHAFPTTSRVFGYLCAQASRELSGLRTGDRAGDQLT
ncbi:MAG: NAD(P)/FAD-dependent oxidoreductase [Chloroflexi bacterium]|nr:NAD(P)/FAD-dependent oxidoreductase [Chloroflexota bacterium]